MGDRGGAYRVLGGDTCWERDSLADLGVDGNVIAEWIFMAVGKTWTGLIWPRI